MIENENRKVWRKRDDIKWCSGVHKCACDLLAFLWRGRERVGAPRTNGPTRSGLVTAPLLERSSAGMAAKQLRPGVARPLAQETDQGLLRETSSGGVGGRGVAGQ